MNILHYTGMPYSSKYGGLERWFVEFCLQSTFRGDIVNVVYTDRLPENCNYIKDIRDNGGTISICKTISDLVDYVSLNHIEVVFCHFNEPYEIGPYLKNVCNVMIYQFLHCFNYYYDLMWIKNFREKL